MFVLKTLNYIIYVIKEEYKKKSQIFICTIK